MVGNLPRRCPSRHDRRVSAQHAVGMASRCARFRSDRRRLAAGACPNALAALPAEASTAVDPRDRPRTAVGLHNPGVGSVVLATCHLTYQGTSLFDHVSDAAPLSFGSCHSPEPIHSCEAITTCRTCGKSVPTAVLYEPIFRLCCACAAKNRFYEWRPGPELNRRPTA